MATRTILGNKIKVGQTFTYQATILEEDGVTPVDLTGADIDVLCSLYRDDTDVTINSRNAQSVITAGVASNEHTGDASGVLTFKATAADTNIAISADTQLVLRYAIDYDDVDTDERVLIYEVEFTLQPLDTLT